MATGMISRWADKTRAPQHKGALPRKGPWTWQRHRPMLVAPQFDQVLPHRRQRLVDWAARDRRPAHARLMFFVAPLTTWTRSSGARHAVLPVEQSTKFELAINMKTAKTVVLRMPPSLLVCLEKVSQ